MMRVGVANYAQVRESEGSFFWQKRVLCVKGDVEERDMIRDMKCGGR